MLIDIGKGMTLLKPSPGELTGGVLVLKKRYIYNYIYLLG